MKKPLPVRTQIRIPPELHAKLVKEAEKNNSSLNDAMVFYIEKGLSGQHDSPSIHLNSYMETELLKIIESQLVLAEKIFQKMISDKKEILEGLTRSDIDDFLRYKLENKDIHKKAP